MLYFLYKLGEFLMNLLPLRAGYRLATGIADIKYFTSIKDKRILINNLRMALGISEAEAKLHTRGIFRNFCKYLVDFFRQGRVDREYTKNFVKVRGTEYLEEAFNKGKGVVALSAHIGNWELGAAVFSLLGYPLNIIALSHKDKRINDFFNKMRQMKGSRVIQVGGSVKKCLSALDKNEAVAVLADRDFSKSDLVVKFFGRDTIMPKGVGIFKAMRDCAVVPTFAIREPNDTHSFIFEKPIEYSPAAEAGKDIGAIVQESLGIIEEYVKKYPDQWFMFGELWPEAK